MKVTDSQLLEDSKTLTVKEISEKYGIRTKNVYKRYRHLGIPIGKRGSAPGGQNRKVTDEQLKNDCKTLTAQEIADKYGMHIVNVRKRCGKLDIKPKAATRVYASDPLEWHYLESAEKTVMEYAPDFDFVSYKGEKVKIRCQKCGDVLIRNTQTIKRYKTTCETCKGLKKGRNELISALNTILEEKTPKTCFTCEKTFYSPYSSQKYCSDRCKKKAKKCGGYRSRAKHYGVEYQPGISLVKVYKRDAGICQICGLPVDWSDNEFNGIVGAYYPTVDHITALANGGGHTWDNVQLAHFMCNSEKRDLVV